MKIMVGLKSAFLLCFLSLSACVAVNVRQGPSRANLQRDRLSSAYRTRLTQAAAGFDTWCRKQGLRLDRLAKDPQRMSETLVAYVQHLHDAGSALWVATHAVLAMQTMFRPLRGRLRAAWDSVLSWRMQAPVKSRVPMPEKIMLALCRYAVLAAVSLDTQHSLIWWNFMAVLRLSFHGLLRPKEIFGPFCSDVRASGPGSLLHSDVAVLTIREPKNRAHMGRLQVRLIREPTTVRWICWLTESLPGGSPLWLFSPQRFRKCLKEGLEFFSLGALRLTAASLRAGGATRLLELGVPVANIKIAGCWASERALASYLQEAEAAGALLKLSGPQLRRLETFLSRLAHTDLPPAVAFASLG